MIAHCGGDEDRIYKLQDDIVHGEYFTLQFSLLVDVLSPPLRPLPLLPEVFFKVRGPLLSRSLGVLVCSSQEAQDLVDLLLSQLDPGIYRVADLVQESLGGVRCLDVTDSSLLEKTRACSGKAVFGDTVGAEMGTKSSIGPGEVSSRTTAVILVSEKRR